MAVMAQRHQAIRSTLRRRPSREFPLQHPPGQRRWYSHTSRSSPDQATLADNKADPALRAHRCARLCATRATRRGTMIRKSRTASQLQDEVSRRIHRLPDIVEEGVKIRVPRPQLQEPDATGCNWDMKHFGNLAGYARDVAAIVAAVRKEFNLSTETKDLGGPFDD